MRDAHRRPGLRRAEAALAAQAGPTTSVHTKTVEHAGESIPADRLWRKRQSQPHARGCDAGRMRTLAVDPVRRIRSLIASGDGMTGSFIPIAAS